MEQSDAAPAKDLQGLSQAGTAQEVLRSQTGTTNYCYVSVRCKTCLGEGRTTWLPIKYLGLEGNKAYTLVLPPAPRMARFHLYCEACEVDDSYSRTDAQIVSLEKAPGPEFVNLY